MSEKKKAFKRSPIVAQVEERVKVKEGKTRVEFLDSGSTLLNLAGSGKGK